MNAVANIQGAWITTFIDVAALKLSGESKSLGKIKYKSKYTAASKPRTIRKKEFATIFFSTTFG